MLRTVFILLLVGGIAYVGYEMMSDLFSGPNIDRRKPVTAGGVDIDRFDAPQGGPSIKPLTEGDDNPDATPADEYDDGAGYSG